MPSPSSASPQAAITSVGHYLPETRLTNGDLEEMVETSDEWIRTRTGIQERRILGDDGKATAFMATAAAQEALDSRGIEPDAVDLIVVATVTPDMLFPATACLVQDNLGASNAWGFDLSAACSGFIYALTTGAQFIETGQAETVLLIGADKMSSIVDYTDRTTCILFGDAAGAVVLEADEEAGLHDAVHHVDGEHSELLRMRGGGSLNPPTHETVDAHMHYLQQEGRQVFKLAVNRMANVCREVLDRNGLDAAGVDYLVPHQANQRIIDATAKQLGLSSEQVMVNIDRYGNTTAATIPLCLYDWEDELERGDDLIVTAFGGGLTWGAGHLTWAYG
ncbi:beta-ketoacyl-ACP synthase III [Salinibacter ruber]|uniref:beta-ketoacyl-ACP synthase III n=1 Tax=Salinibacter ruber TaxID=146919 RepID=UPI000E5868F8|nr:beta-ketoacyl-ACP synthase III [Salinibacter ruber]MCS3642739.1 3-oxoacyl-[acyl-carrier-protein] synthase-3 [Salinibacter ruber]MCS3685340.1 3-oxoacyl-[acyl-carrier-protein] synthase-3 [Salinibacter ruber]MCS3754572.1 3-oxoacyl-[acyl-carrier-protein] synthase-3 [Salinibacter ruber]MCS4033334.1 3-oxoacyl-[acyl-carrier-protein] synthase-3 [Salinibacter ruber]